MIALLYINVFLQQHFTGYASDPKANVSIPTSCDTEIQYEEVNDPEFLSLFHLAEKCMENVCEETQIKTVAEICHQETNVTETSSSSNLLDIIIIAGVTSVVILAIAAIGIVYLRKRRSRIQNPHSTEIAASEVKQQSLRMAGLRPLPIPEEEPRYSYLEILEVPKINTNQMSSSQTSVTVDYLEPNQVPSQKKLLGTVRRRLPSSNPDEHFYQEIQTCEIMK